MHSARWLEVSKHAKLNQHHHFCCLVSKKQVRQAVEVFIGGVVPACSATSVQGVRGALRLICLDAAGAHGRQWWQWASHDAAGI